MAVAAVAPAQGTETVTIRTFNVHIGINFGWVPVLRDPIGSIFGRGGSINDDRNGGIYSDVYFGGLPSVSFRLISNFFISITSNTVTRQIQTSDEEQSPASRPMGAGAQEGAAINLNFSEGTKRVLTRPAIAEQRLSLASNGNVMVALKTPYDDGTSHVVLSPMEFVGRLAALVPSPRINLTRFHGVFSPRSRLREFVVPEKTADDAAQAGQCRNKVYSMTWAQRLKRVFAIEIERCENCGGRVKIIASIEDPEVIEKILKHLGQDEASQTRNRSPPTGLFDYATELF